MKPAVSSGAPTLTDANMAVNETCQSSVCESALSSRISLDVAATNRREQPTAECSEKSNLGISWPDNLSSAT